MTFARPSTVWTVFAVCIAVLLAAMAWVTAHTLRLEHERRAADEERELQERVRLALWRMDSTAGALVIAENARPANHFRDFHPADQAYTNTYQILQKGSVILPSPLLSDIPDHTKLYCQLNTEGTLTSPQVPSGNSRDLAEQNYVTQEEINDAAALLEKARTIFPAPAVAATPDIPVVTIEQQSDWSVQQVKSSDEFISRSQSSKNSISLAQNTQKMPSIKSTKAVVNQQVAEAGIGVGVADQVEPFEGVWQGDELFLLRKATLDGQPVTQGIWLNTAQIKQMLLQEISDLLPSASLLPVTAPAGAATAESLLARTRHVASLPFQLEPGEVSVDTADFWSPMRRSLALAWACAVVATAATGGLLFGIVGLSERRAAFVSAVTHEMRTPLTTFRLYSEMLASNMVTDPDKRTSYFSTLTSEANRLSHLVENVLAYSQLERGSARARIEETTLQAIVDRILPRLEQRATMADMQIKSTIDSVAGATRIKVDLTAVEQILFNLVDNACKYARPADDAPRIIHIEAVAAGPGANRIAMLRVRDHGRGISKNEERRLFRPFEKSATDAAHTAPGVGLGLALCRKLARALGGELYLCRENDGGCFVLTLPTVAGVEVE
ncbi:MAG: HAMP domain-containing histidine kinase [Verrucomicrobiae bacterium]|nr:HAMP domain-containing histidine kinase [Verrucomicrobiae bacterium]